ncbi:SMC-Scp complex subunit ScpB [Micromonospora sp. NPDC048835]|uniref:SMC-Scp complex subunit ScpB n=1 Tax=Micromonospora sp. NPDC048835 TaxID=3155147 RepID=UPI0033CA7637
MSEQERRDSLAEQAAAWVPPWDRPRPPAADTPTPSEEPATPSDAEEQPGSLEAAPDGVSRGARGPVEAASEEIGSADSDLGGVTENTPGPVLAATVEDAPGPDRAAVPEGTAGESGGAGDVPRRQLAGRRRATAAPEPAPELADAELRGALEAILLVVDEPVSELVLAQVLEQPAERVGPMLDEIAAGYTAAGHGFELRRAAGGWRLYTRPEYATYVERFVLDGQSVRLTQAALETLAVVAYKQPVTRSRISAIRGVNCDGVIRTLVTRGLVEECGTEQDSGAFLYRTTTLFLEKLGLNTVDELPPLAPFLPDDVEELADATR